MRIGPRAGQDVAAPQVLAIVGPTAVGKSSFALSIASEIDAEIVSIDSAQIYRGMDIGTDKPSEADRAKVRHHMLDVIDPVDAVTVAEFQKMARSAITDVLSRKKTPILVGGSGLYFRAVVDELHFPPTDRCLRAKIESETEDSYGLLRQLDPEAANRIDPANQRRVVRALEVIELTGRKFSSFRTAWEEFRSIYPLVPVGLSLPRDELDARINARVDRMIEAGLIDEVRGLIAKGFRESLTSVQALGYAQVLAFLEGDISLEDAVDQIRRRTRRFARRQLSWFKADPRVRWFEADNDAARRFMLEGGSS